MSHRGLIDGTFAAQLAALTCVQVKESCTELAEARESAAENAATITSLSAQNKLLQSKVDTLQAEVSLHSYVYGSSKAAVSVHALKMGAMLIARK